MKIIAVRDRAIDAYGIPFFTRSIGEAIRSFTDEANNNQSAINAHPEDYDLYCFGDYDQDTGEFKIDQKPHQIAIGKDQIKKEA